VATIQHDELASGGLRPHLQARRPRRSCGVERGFVLLAFQVFVLAKWALGPNFKSTDPGPDALPAWSQWFHCVADRRPSRCGGIALSLGDPAAAPTRTPHHRRDDRTCGIDGVLLGPGHELHVDDPVL